MADRQKFSDVAGFFGKASGKMGSVADQLFGKLAEATDNMPGRAAIGSAASKAGEAAGKLGEEVRPVIGSAVTKAGELAGKLGARIAGRTPDMETAVPDPGSSGPVKAVDGEDVVDGGYFKDDGALRSGSVAAPSMDGHDSAGVDRGMPGADAFRTEPVPVKVMGIGKGAVSDYFGIYLEDAQKQFGGGRMKSVRFQDPVSADGSGYLIVPEANIKETPGGSLDVRLGMSDEQALYVRMAKDGSLETVPMNNGLCQDICEAGRDGRGTPLWATVYGDVDPVMQRNYLRSVPACDIEMEADTGRPCYRIRIPDKLSGVGDTAGHHGYGELIVDATALKEKEDGTFDVNLNGMLDSLSTQSTYYRWVNGSDGPSLERASVNPAIIASNYNKARDEHVFLTDVPMDKVIPAGIDPETGKPATYDIVTMDPRYVSGTDDVGKYVRISVDASAVTFAGDLPVKEGPCTVDLGRALDRSPVACKNCYLGHVGMGSCEDAMDRARTGSGMVDLYGYGSFGTGTGEAEKGYLMACERVELAEADRIQRRRDKIAGKSAPVLLTGLQGVEPESVSYYDGPYLDGARQAVGGGNPLVVKIPDPKAAPAEGETTGYGLLFVSDDKVWPGRNGKLAIEMGGADEKAVYLRPQPDGKLVSVDMRNDEAAVVCESGLFGYVTDETRRRSARSRDLVEMLGTMQVSDEKTDRQAGE